MHYKVPFTGYYLVEADSPQEALDKAADEDYHERYEERSPAEELEEEREDPDAHSCRAHADEYGICQWCGAIVSGTSADYELHGYDPV